jgi:hypothetical protein
VDAMREIAENRGGPARAALDGHRRPEDGEAPKPKGKYTKKKIEPKKKPCMSLVIGLGVILTDSSSSYS